MKKILFLLHSTSLTGAPLLLHDIAALFDANRYELCFIIPEEGPLADRFRMLGPTIVEPVFPDELKYWRELKRIWRRLRILRSIKPDLVYCNTIHPAKWLFYARLLRIPTITHVHELAMGFASLGWLDHLFVKMFSNGFIAVSDAVRNYLVLEQHIDPNKVRVIRAGINLGTLKPDARNTPLKQSLGLGKAFVVGTVGRITHMKGTDLFLQVAAKLKLMVPSQEIKFLLIGTTEDLPFYKSFRSLLAASGLESDFIVLENIRTVVDYYGVMDVYVSTAREDPFPLVILEAMASALPVVAFSVGGIPEAIAENCGILVNANDVEAMAEKVAGLVRDEQHRRLLGTAARERVMREFDLSSNFHQIESMMDGLMTSPL